MAATATKLIPVTEPATVLERLLRDRAGLADELATLQASSTRLRETSASEAVVLAEINAMAAADVDGMTKWASEGCHGEAPRSDQQKRIVLGQRLNAAQAAAIAASGAGQDIDAKIAALQERCTGLAGEIEQNVFDQIERELSDVIREYVGVCERGSALATRISGLALLFRETGNDRRAAVIFATKLPSISTNPREVQLAADAWSRRIADLRSGK